MTRHELMQLFSRRTGLCPERADELGTIFLDCMKDGLIEERELKIHGFGSFSVWINDSFWRKNRFTKQPEFIPTRRFIKFKPGKNLKNRLNERTEDDGE